jgi:hypothetical protein
MSTGHEDLSRELEQKLFQLVRESDVWKLCQFGSREQAIITDIAVPLLAELESALRVAEGKLAAQAEAIEKIRRISSGEQEAREGEFAEEALVEIDKICIAILNGGGATK